jgi:fermentation-respiration switch protein FrsA (DUF1100 family)
VPAELLTGALLASAFYIGLAPRINIPLYRQLLFFPARFPVDFPGLPTLEGVTGEDVFFKGEMGQKLNGWYFQKPDCEYVILFNHGNSGNLTIRHHISRLMILSGYSVFVYDYQGFGRSSGRPTIDGIVSDGAAAYDYLVNERGVDPRKIILYGESLGVSVAVHLSTIRECQGLILQSGFASLTSIARRHFPLLRIYPTSLFPQPAFDNIAILKNSTKPLLIIHGELDKVIPVQHAADLYQAHGGMKKFVRLPATAHGDVWSTAEREYLEAMMEFPQTVRDCCNAVASAALENSSKAAS